jgi:sn-glycerol 3-phosphate transport system permease protein
MLREDPFGLSQFVWFANFEKVLSDPNYLNSLKVTVVFSARSTAVVSMVVALLLAVMADKSCAARVSIARC